MAIVGERLHGGVADGNGIDVVEFWFRELGVHLFNRFGRLGCWFGGFHFDGNHLGFVVDKRIVHSAHNGRQGAFQHMQLHTIAEILARVEYNQRIAGMPQSGRHGVPTKPIKMHANPVIYCFLHAWNHVGVARY